jgi:hydroxypyruvate isomerase
MKEKHSEIISRTSRRSFIKASAVIGATCGIAPALAAQAEEYKVKGRIKQSVCKWCYGSIPMEEFAAYAAKIGLKAIELVGPSDWPILKKHGLVCSMSNSHGIAKGLNRKENHEECLAKIRKSIEETAEAGFPNVICFSGNREGMDDDEGMKNCEIAAKQIVGFAEKKKINLCIELLNSKRNHKDYMCDRTHWGAELVKRVGSPRFKLLYDIYHMQVQEGDIIATIQEYGEYFAHYHTGGVPGRNEIDDSQELNYPTIMKAIVKTGFDGYVAQEFIPKRDPLTSLAESVRICDV